MSKGDVFAGTLIGFGLTSLWVGIVGAIKSTHKEK